MERDREARGTPWTAWALAPGGSGVDTTTPRTTAAPAPRPAPGWSAAHTEPALPPGPGCTTVATPSRGAGVYFSQTMNRPRPRPASGHGLPVDLHHRRYNATPPAYDFVVSSARSRPNRRFRSQWSAMGTSSRSSSRTPQYFCPDGITTGNARVSNSFIESCNNPPQSHTPRTSPRSSTNPPHATSHHSSPSPREKGFAGAPYLAQGAWQDAHGPVWLGDQVAICGLTVGAGEVMALLLGAGIPPFHHVFDLLYFADTEHLVALRHPLTAPSAPRMDDPPRAHRAGSVRSAGP